MGLFVTRDDIDLHNLTTGGVGGKSDRKCEDSRIPGNAHQVESVTSYSATSNRIMVNVDDKSQLELSFLENDRGTVDAVALIGGRVEPLPSEHVPQMAVACIT